MLKEKVASPVEQVRRKTTGRLKCTKPLSLHVKQWIWVKTHDTHSITTSVFMYALQTVACVWAYYTVSGVLYETHTSWCLSTGKGENSRWSESVVNVVSWYNTASTKGSSGLSAHPFISPCAPCFSLSISPFLSLLLAKGRGALTNNHCLKVHLLQWYTWWKANRLKMFTPDTPWPYPSLQQVSSGKRRSWRPMGVGVKRWLITLLNFLDITWSRSLTHTTENAWD